MIVEFISTLALSFIQKIGYFGIFIMMALESTVVPLPSEIVMPFAGFLVTKGTFSFLMVIVVSTLGTLFGSSFSYWMGSTGGEPLVKKFGKYVFLDETHLRWTEQWFSKYGEKTIFIGRFLPVVRHFISIPAGIGKMSKKHFVLYTLFGGFVWNSFLTCLGVILGKNWWIIHKYSTLLDILVFVAIFFGIVVYLYLYFRRKRVQTKGY